MNTGNTDFEIIDIKNLCDASSIILKLNDDKSSALLVRSIVDGVLHYSGFTFVDKINWIQDLRHSGFTIMLNCNISCKICGKKLKYDKDNKNNVCSWCEKFKLLKVK